MLALAAGLAWLSCAIALSVGWVSALCVGLAGLSTALLARRWPKLAIVGACVGVVLLASSARLHERQTGPVHRAGADRSVATLEGTVSSDPKVVAGRVIGQSRTQDLVRIRVQVRRLTVAGRTYAVHATIDVQAEGAAWRELLPSQRVRLAGRFAAPRTSDVSAGFSARGEPVLIGRPGAVQRAAARLRAGLRDSTQGLADGPRGLLPGLVDGDTSRLDTQVADDFKATSLTHLVAVSGSNVSIVLACVLGLAGLLGASPRVRSALAVLGLIAFVVVARPSPSVLRAAAMGAVTLLALVTGRPRRALPALGAAVVVLLCIDPDLARSVGFALSAFATAGIVVLAPWLAGRMPQRWPLLLRQSLAVPLAAQLACAPVIGAAFGTVGLSAVPANLLAAPAVAPATIAGVAAAIAALVWLPAASWTAELGGFACGWLVEVAHRMASLPASSLSIPGGVRGALIASVVTVITAMAILQRQARKALVASIVGCLVAALLVVPVLDEQWPPAGWTFAACDVGQGDGLVVRGGEQGDVLVDTGPDPAKLSACLHRLHVRMLQRVILTHLHADHVEGLPAVLGHYRVATIEVGPLKEPAEEWSRVTGWARAAAVPVVEAVIGERGAAGDAQWEVLGPSAVFRGTDSDPNNASLVLALRTHGVSLLLTGDAEDVAQSSLLARVGGVIQADVLKLPHHGSAKQDPTFLDSVRARITVTSVGLGNPYGHPSPITLGRLASTGAAVLRTDLDGSVAIARVGTDVLAFPSRGSRHRRRTGTVLAGQPRGDPRFWCSGGSRTVSAA